MSVLSSNTDLNTYIGEHANSQAIGNAYLGIISFIIFGSVVDFTVVYIINFIKAYKGEKTLDVDFSFLNKKKKTKDESNVQGSIKNFINKNQIECEFCGTKNDSDSRFCKNCGNQIK